MVDIVTLQKNMNWQLLLFCSNISIGQREYDLSRISWIGRGEVSRGVVIGGNSVITKNMSPHTVMDWQSARLIHYRFDIKKILLMGEVNRILQD